MRRQPMCGQRTLNPIKIAHPRLRKPDTEAQLLDALERDMITTGVSGLHLPYPLTGSLQLQQQKKAKACRWLVIVMRQYKGAGRSRRSRLRQQPVSAKGIRSVQPCDSSNQVTVCPPRCRHPHRAERPATSWSPRPPSASSRAGRSSGTPGPPSSVTSTRTMPSSAPTATVTVWPGTPDPGVPHAVAEQLAH